MSQRASCEYGIRWVSSQGGERIVNAPAPPGCSGLAAARVVIWAEGRRLMHEGERMGRKRGGKGRDSSFGGRS